MHDCLIINLQILKSYSLLSTEVNVLPIEKRKKKSVVHDIWSFGKANTMTPMKGIGQKTLVLWVRIPISGPVNWDL